VYFVTGREKSIDELLVCGAEFFRLVRSVL